MEVSTRVDRLEAALAALAEAQERTEQHLQEFSVTTRARLDELAAAGQQTERTLQEFGAETKDRLDQFTDAAAQTQRQLAELISWQRGEDGRRRGEGYERRLRRRAFILFQGGDGGTTDEAAVRARVTPLLVPTPGGDLPPNADISLSDLLWWKGDQVAVVEASLVVDDGDVYRAHERAETLRRAAAQAIPVVVGETWADDYTRRQARELGVEWKVGDDDSQGFIAFRRLPAS